MSAWIVSMAHIDALIRVALVGPNDGEARWDPFGWRWNDERRTLDHETAERVGSMLVATNVASVSYRYPDASPADLGSYGDAYAYNRGERWPSLSIAEACKALDCYEYQSGERPDWPESEAYAFCDELRRVLTTHLPGYDAAPWGID